MAEATIHSALARRVQGTPGAFVLAVALALAAAAPAETVTAQRAAALQPAIESEFDLRAYTVQQLTVIEQLNGAYATEVELEGQTAELALRLHSVLRPNYQLKVQMADGSMVSLPPGPVGTFRGHVVGADGSIVAGGFEAGGIRARVELPDGKVYWIEPLAGRIAAAATGEHVVYDDAARPECPGECGTTGASFADELDEFDPTLDGSLRGGCGGGLCVAEVAFDSDVEFFHSRGSSVEAVEARIATVINTMNAQYEREVGITHEVGTIIVRTAEPDPYSGTDPGALLNQFANHWNASQSAIPRDVAHLFTGRSLDDPVIGIAFLGTLCDRSNAYSLVQNLGTLACATDLSAHELGHNWNASHCTCAAYTMNPSLTCANQFHPTLTIPTIVSFRDSRTCLGALETGTTTLPFFDSFPSTSINPVNWTGVDGATVNALGSGEPSPPNSLNLDGSSTGGDQVRSAIIDTSGFGGLELSYNWQRTGTADSPETGDDLVVEYLRDTLAWTEIARHPGAGSDTLPYTFASVDLPSDALHSTFRLRFRSISSSSGSDDWFVDNVSIAGCFAATITTQPVDELVCDGGTAQFTAVGTGGGAITYRWLKDDVELTDGGTVSGATTTTLTIGPVSPADAGTYTCKITNDCVPILSDPAILSLVVPVSIVTQPAPLLTRCDGTSALFTVESDGSSLTYQWQKNGIPLADDGRITGTRSATLVITGVTATDEGSYTCLVADPCGGEEQSNPGVLQIVSPVFTDHPQDTCVGAGETAVFTAAAVAPPPQVIGWRWRKDGALLVDGGRISGSLTDTLVISNAAPADAGQYLAVAFTFDPVCVTDSAPAALLIGDCAECLTPGDLDADGDYDLADLQTFTICFGVDVGLVPGCACANVDSSDDIVDHDDWTALAPLIDGPL